MVLQREAGILFTSTYGCSKKWLEKRVGSRCRKYWMEKKGGFKKCLRVIVFL